MIGAKLSNISIKYKVMCIVLVPILGMAILAGMKINDLRLKSIEQSHLVSLMDISSTANDLVHQLQVERGVSSGYIDSKGTKFTKHLSKQHDVVDEKRQHFRKTLSTINLHTFGDAYEAQIKQALAGLNTLKNIRHDVGALTISSNESLALYTHINKQLLQITARAISIISDPITSRGASAYLFFIRAKDNAGLERSAGTAGFGSGWTPELLRKFSNLAVVQDTLLKSFQEYAAKDIEQQFIDSMSDPAIAKVKTLRAVAYSDAPDSISGMEWFKAITDKMEILKKVEDNIASELKRSAYQNARKASSLQTIYIVTMLSIILVVLSMAYTITRELLHNIKNVSFVLKELSQQNDNVQISGVRRGDEMGVMARALSLLKQGITERKRINLEMEKNKKDAEEEKRRNMLEMADAFDRQVGKMVHSLSEASQALRPAAEKMRAVADNTATSSTTVADSTEKANANVMAVASAMEEMSATSNEISKQITGAKTKSNDTVTNAEQANTTVSNLNELVGNIGEVVVAIKNIAEQTNLLALNATIEAAGAGESGKGFAVVANEVKKLANETAKKTGEIEHRISQIQAATSDSVRAMSNIISNIDEIDQSITGISAAVEQQNATNAEIVRSITEASGGVQKVAEVIESVRQDVNHTGMSAAKVLESTEELVTLSGNVQTSVDSFLSHLRKGEDSSSFSKAG